MGQFAVDTPSAHQETRRYIESELEFGKPCIAAQDTVVASKRRADDGRQKSTGHGDGRTKRAFAVTSHFEHRTDIRSHADERRPS